MGELKPSDKGLTVDTLQLGYREFKQWVGENLNELDRNEREWLHDWESYDMVISPIDDEERRLARYYHCIGWFAKARTLKND